MKYIINMIRILFLALLVFLVINGKLLLWLVLFALSLLLALLFGRVYCGYVCPMNTVMIPTEFVSKKLGLQTNKIPKWLSSGNFGWFALLASVISFFLSRRILNKNLPILLIWIIVSVIITLRYKPVVFHNLICPYGKLQKLFGKFAIFSERVNKDDCIGCKRCESVCPSEAIIVKLEDKKAEINTAICLQCTNCQQICPVNAIHYSKKEV